MSEAEATPAGTLPTPPAGTADAGPDGTTATSSTIWGELHRFFVWVLPPVLDRRFWLTQGLVLVVFAAHLVMHLDFHGLPDVLVVTAYAFPVVYAALEFGFRGAVATTLLVIALTLHYVIDDALTGSTVDLAGHSTELAVLAIVAPVVGVVIERERVARRAHEAAVIRYRALFAASGIPALVLNRDDRIQEANPAAKSLLNADMDGRRLSDVLGEEVAAAVLSGGESANLAVAPGLELRPIVSRVESRPGEQLTQVLFQDVSEEAAGTRRTRTFALAVLSAQEEERRRIAQELHDEALQLCVELRRRIDRAIRTEDAGELGEARALADDVIDELRRVALRLRPADLDDLGLRVALDRLVTESRRRGTPAELVVDGDLLDLEPEVTLALYRVAQEALTNAEHHARAGSVAVRLAFDPGLVTLSVEDDGVGFDPDALSSEDGEGHLGLLGMRERLKVVGGRLEILSAPGRGTTVVASVPEPRA